MGTGRNPDLSGLVKELGTPATEYYCQTCEDEEDDIPHLVELSSPDS